MQVPEKLALIGGSILLSSTLIFTLRSQASSLLPKIASPIKAIDRESSNTPTMAQFNNGYQWAQKNGWQTGKWGKASYYIDDQHNMYLGSGDLQVDHLRSVIGGDQADNLTSLHIDGHVKAGGNTFLFSNSTDGDYRDSKLTTIEGLKNVELAPGTMGNTFGHDTALRNADLNDLDISHNNDMYDAFDYTPLLHVTTHWNLNNKNLFGTFYDSGINNEQ